MCESGEGPAGGDSAGDEGAECVGCGSATVEDRAKGIRTPQLISMSREDNEAFRPRHDFDVVSI